MAILILLVSERGASGDDQAVRLDAFGLAYYLFKDAGIEVTLASVAGGWPWPGLERRSSEATPGFARLAGDSAAREELADTLRLDQVCVEDFEGAYCVGLVGPIWRSPEVAGVEAVLAQFLASGRPVAVIPSVLDLSPRGAGNGLLITGEPATSAGLAATTLLAAVRARVADREGAS